MSIASAIARYCRKLEHRLVQLAERKEDRISVEKMRQAEREGYLTPAENAAFIRKMRSAFRL